VASFSSGVTGFIKAAFGVLFAGFDVLAMPSSAAFIQKKQSLYSGHFIGCQILS